MKLRSFSTMTALWLLPVMTAPAFAQDTPAEDQEVAPESGDTTATTETEETIFVTGGRGREELAQDAPIAVAVLGGEQLQDSNVKNLSDLDSMTPNLTITTMGSIAATAGISIRGFSAVNNDPAAEPGVAVYIDGVYQVQNFGSLSDLYDVERVEVLSGPQSALLGKSASAGALLINHTRPTGRFGVDAELEYGSYDQFRANARLNFPIVNGKLAGKLYAGYERRDGYMRHVTLPGVFLNGVKRGTIRGALLFTPSDRLEIYVTGDYTWDNSDQVGGRNTTGTTRLLCTSFGVCNPFGNQYKVLNSDYFDRPELDYNNVAGHVTWRPGAVQLTSITGYSRLKATQRNDLDSVPGSFLHLLQTYDVKAFSEEVRLTPEENGGLTWGGRLSWVLGGFYAHSPTVSNAGNTILLTTRNQSQRLVRDTYAVFGQLDIDVIDNLTVSFGARRSHDKVRQDYNFAAVTPGTIREPIVVRPRDLTHEASFDNTSFEGGLRYKFSESKMAYVRYAEGFRGGGFNGFPGNAFAALPYRPETTKGYEAGIKTAWWNGDLQLNVTVFDVKFKDLQRVVSVLFPGGQAASINTNAASAQTRGLEVQAIARPMRGLQLRGSFGYLDAKYLDYQSYNPATNTFTDLSNQPLTLAPKYTLAGDAAYEMDLGDQELFDTATLRASAAWRSDFEMSNILDVVGHQEGYATVDASLEFARDKGATEYSLSFYIRNMFDTRFQNWANASGGFLQTHIDDIGRTYGVVLGFKF